ncbi:DUF615 domain-containing protein [Desulfosarcina sp. OttesenSCG-928-G10]|nr:DUF615 domain-containing protein [Desulfosarcina sp. OttesenSCG-928-G10]MDL2322102.1 DUF615 domain-containing protein [Desulfosarcina sp. OttesenSCG-928-B08]
MCREENQEENEISRTRRKKDALALQRIGEKLAALSESRLNRMDLPPDLLEAILTLKAMRSHGARRRQIQYVGALMRNVDVAPIDRALREIEQGDYLQASAFHRIEKWRDRLVTGDDALMDEILETFPDADRQRLGKLVRSARKEIGQESSNRSARHLFRYLQALSAENENQ